MSKQLTKVVLENRAWRGLRCYTGEFPFNGKKYSLEISGRNGGIGVESSHTYLERFQSGNTYEGWCGGLDKKEDGSWAIFPTFKHALEYVKETYFLDCTYPKDEKDLLSDWTWEQNITYAEAKNQDKNYEVIQRMAVDRSIRITEVEILKYIKEHPNTTTNKIKQLFPTKEDILTRLCHDYGNSSSPQIKARDIDYMDLTINDKKWLISSWTITEKGLATLEQVEEKIANKGFCDISPY